MKLAIFLNIRTYFDGSTYFAEDNFYQFWTSFTTFFDEVILCLPVLETTHRKGFFPLNQERVKVCPFPYYDSPFGLYLNIFRLIFRIRRLISKNASEWDVVGSVLPNILGIVTVLFSRQRAKRCFFYLRGNFTKSIPCYYSKGLKKLAAKLGVLILTPVISHLVRRTLTFTVGEELYRTFGRTANTAFKIIPAVLPRSMIIDKCNLRINSLGTLKLLYVGRLSAEKGMSYLVDIMPIMIRENKVDAVLNIVGSGPEEVEMRKKVSKLNLNDHVMFKGYVPFGNQLQELYREADVFVLPSITEGVPLVLVEAMAYGLPIVATAVGGIPDIVKHNVNGLLVPPADINALCKALVRIARKPKLRYHLAENALDMADKYCMESQRDIVLQIMNEKWGIV